MPVVIEGYELDDVSRHVFTIHLRVEGLLVGIELVHCTKVCVTHSHDNDREREVGATYNLINSLLHVIDDTISDYDQNVILLVFLSHVFRGNMIIDLANNW